MAEDVFSKMLELHQHALQVLSAEVTTVVPCGDVAPCGTVRHRACGTARHLLVMCLLIFLFFLGHLLLHVFQQLHHLAARHSLVSH